MEWVEHDEVSAGELPDWASASGEVLDGSPYEVRVVSEGLVLKRGRKLSAVRWVDVLAPIRVDVPPRLLIAAARRPPHSPWFELGGQDVLAIDKAIRLGVEALAQGSYRASPRTRLEVTPEQVLESVLAYRPLMGAVEIRVPLSGPVQTTFVTGFAGGGVLGYLGLVLLPVMGPAGPLAGLGLGLALGAALGGGYEYARRRRGARVLVLTPDCFVGGLDGSAVRAIPWERVARFVEGRDDRGRAALEVYSVDGGLVSRSSARYFGQPLDVIVAVAEAYRRRATRPKL